jgi:AraC-like DNA-binding protein
MDDPVIEVGEKGTDLADSFEEILEALKAGDGLAGGAVNAALARIFASLSGLRIPNTTLAETLGAEDRTAGLMRRIRRNLSQEWPVARMAEAAGMSEAQLFRRFGQVTGTTPQAWLRRERIELAAHLLAATPDKIAAIALRCGYSDPFHFSRDFKRLQGEAPRSFRMSRRRSLAAPAEAYWR